MILKIPKWIAPLMIGGLFAGVVATVMAGSAQATTNLVTVHVKQATISDHANDCSDGETSAAHFVITQIGDARPDSIEVTIKDGGTVTVPLLKLTGSTARYEVATHGGVVTDATASVPYDWTGQFNLSHYVCGGDQSSTTTTSTSTTTTPTETTSTTSVPTETTSTTTTATSSTSTTTSSTSVPTSSTSTTTIPSTTTTSSTTSVPSTSTTSTTTSTSPETTTTSASRTTSSTSSSSTVPTSETTTSFVPDTRRTTLAFTGSSAARMLALAGILLAIGSLIMLALRPRKH